MLNLKSVLKKQNPLDWIRSCLRMNIGRWIGGVIREEDCGREIVSRRCYGIYRIEKRLGMRRVS